MTALGAEQSHWTPELDALVTRLWGEGYSATDMMSELPGKSRNSICSKISRLKLPARQRTPPKPKPAKAKPRAPFQPPSDHQVSRPRIGADSRMTMAFDVPSGALTDLPPDESPDAVRFLKREGAKCRWPLNEVVPIEKHKVCGSKCGGEDSYCPRHMRLSTRSAPMMSLSEAERARRKRQGEKNAAASQERLAAS